MGNESTGLKNETEAAKIKISPVVNNRPNILLLWKCKLEPPVEDGGKKKRWKRLRANEQTRLTALLSGKTRGGRRQN